MRWQQTYADKLISSQTAARLVRSGDTVALGHRRGPSNFMLALGERAKDLKAVQLSGSWMADYPWVRPGVEESFAVRDQYVTRFTRAGNRERRIDWIPYLTGLGGDVDRQADANRGRTYNYADFFVTFVTPPDDEGYCSWGPDLWWSPGASATAKTVIAEVDYALPFVCGDKIHASKIDYFIDEPFGVDKSFRAPTPSVEEFELLQVIGAFAADLVQDGDTVQIGTGSASEAVFEFLDTKNDLGIHSEIVDPALINLVRVGIATGKRKSLLPGKAVGGGCTIAQYPEAKPILDYLEHNPLFEWRDVSWVSSIPVIAANDNMVVINTALAIDLQGQLNCTSFGTVPIGGPGGQVEFCIGAHYSKGGRSVHCLPSTAVGGSKSRIVPQFDPGSQILVPMPYVDYVVTEFGVVNLENKSRRERAEALISIAHPDFRAELRKAARELFWP